MDWKQLWEICSAPDNVPIVGMIPLLIFYCYLAWQQAKANDDLIGELETNPALAKTHHRKSWPFRPGWQKEVHVWPFLLRIEFLATMIVTIILMIWSITLYAPLEEPANPNLTMNPAKAPWYFLGLQELLHFFPPFVAGILIPTLVVIALIVIPYFNVNVEGKPLWDEQASRRFGIVIGVVIALLIPLAVVDAWTIIVPTVLVAGLLVAAFLSKATTGWMGALRTKPLSWWVMTWFIATSVCLTVVGTFFRGPGWSWVWPWGTHAA